MVSWKILILSFFYLYTFAQEDTPDPYRLPENVRPSRYDLELTVGENFNETASFTGTVSITIRLLEPSNTITLNSLNITYPEGSYTITREAGDDPEPITLELEVVDTYEMIVLTANTELEANVNYILKFENYIGILHDDMAGFYLSSYTNADGEIEYIATTQFQTTDARKAFPCFDEPNFKAVFSITINRPEGFNSLANTKQTSASTATQDKYEDTPLMSTYLISFIVSKFQGYLSQGGVREQYDVWTQPDAQSTAKYAYDIGLPILEQLDNYTEISYYEMGVDKMDQIAIPDFSAGAMENWGLVTYRETSLLWDEEQSTITNKQRVATVIAHEFTHMWFGNLVTLNWWEYTWLNEGFARYFQYFITAKVEPTWELMTQFVIEQQQVIFATDGLESAAALNSKASSRSQVSSKFASTSYSKGASIIRMMVNILGEEEFHQGIKDYLGNHSYSNTVPSDLFADLQLYAPDSLPATLDVIMESWTENPGYPVVTVSRTSGGLSLTQERFLLNSSATSTTKWYVPISYTTQENPDFTNTTITDWMLPENTNTLIELDEDSTGWVVVNLLETGYYRVNYSEELWTALGEALHADDFDKVFPELNRAQIVDDILNLARANKIQYPLALNVTTFLENEVSYYPWYSAFQAFLFLRRRIDSTSYVGLTLQTHILALMKNLYDDVSFTITSETAHVTVLKTALTLQWACELGLEECVTTADELFKDLVDNGVDVNPNIRSTVYCSALRQAQTNDYWNFLWQRYQDSRLATEQSIILTALGCSKDESILNQYLLYSIDGTYIRKQDANTVFSAVLAGNPGNVEVAFQFLKEHIEDVVNYYEGMNALSSIINGVADRLTTETLIEEFEAFIIENRDILKDAAETGDAAIESAKANLQWVESNQDELQSWLYETYGSATSVTLSFCVLLTGLIVTFLNN